MVRVDQAQLPIDLWAESLRYLLVERRARCAVTQRIDDRKESQ